MYLRGAYGYDKNQCNSTCIWGRKIHTSIFRQYRNCLLYTSYYVENVSFLLDIKMVYGLVKMVFDKKTTAIRGGAFRGSFMGYNRDGSSISSLKVPMKYYEKAVERLGY